MAYIARQFYLKTPYSHSYEDLYQEGCIGLIKAVDNYNGIEHGFKRYIDIKITGAIKDYLRRMDFLTRDQRESVKDKPNERDLIDQMIEEVKDELAYEGINPEEQAIMKDLRLKIYSSIAQFSPKMSKIFTMYLNNEDKKEITAQCDVTLYELNKYLDLGIRIMKDAIYASCKFER